MTGPGVTRVSKNGMDPLVVGTCAVICMCGSMELVFCKNCWLCSAFWVKMSHPHTYTITLVGRGSADGLGFKLFHEQVGYNGTGGGTHGCTMDLFIIVTLQEEIGILDRTPAMC